MNEHIDPARLVEFVEERLDRASTDKVEQHVAGCGQCSAELELARRYVETSVGAEVEGRSEALKSSFATRLDQRLDSPKEPTRTPRRGLSGRWLSRGLLAASIAVIGFGLLQFRSSTRPGDDELGRRIRSEGSSGVLELDVQPVAGGSLELTWTAPTGARDLKLRVIAADGSLVFERDVESSPMLLEMRELGEDAGNAELLMQLVGTDANGSTLRSVPQRLLPGT